MKKSISVVLSCLLIMLSLCQLFASAAAEPFGRVNNTIPTINIAGDGNAIVIPDETVEGGERQVFKMNALLNNFDSSDDSSVSDALANLLLPFLKEGILKNNWEPYYENLQKEVGDLFEYVQLDKDGNAQYGTTIPGWHRWVNWYNQEHDNKGDKGFYDFDDYHFWYDWRLDPVESAEQLHTYIQNVKRVTGSDKVALLSSCLGSNVALAYVATYGTDDLYGLAIDATVANGSEFISEAISGDFHLDGNAIVRFLDSANGTNLFSVSDFIRDTVDLATQSGLLDGISLITRLTIYDKVKEGVTSALALGTVMTMPCYWACVSPEDYEEAKLYVFGEPGSQKRIEYAGLIEKLDRYHDQVSCRVDELLQTVYDNNVLLAVMAKYGEQIVPIGTSNTVIGDEFASLTRASFGATTADSIYDTLSDEYIAQQTALGLEKYISPDRQVDASTCMFPDYTWFIKGATHTIRTDTENIQLYECITADRQLTIDDFELSQYMVYDNQTKVMSAMTEENCHTETFTTDRNHDKPCNIFVKIKIYFESLQRWLRTVFSVIKNNAKEQG